MLKAMARRTAKTRAKPRVSDDRARASEQAGIEQRIVDAALALASERRWREVALADIAERAGVALVDVYRHCPSKAAAVAAFLRRIDAAVLAGTRAEDGEQEARDRLFDVIMRRFDALQPYKQAVASILADTPADPVAALCGARPFLRSMAWMLEAAGLSATGLAGRLRVHGLALVYGTTLRVWLNDDSADLARTMAALDRNLRRAESLIKLLPAALR